MPWRTYQLQPGSEKCNVLCFCRLMDLSVGDSGMLRLKIFFSLPMGLHFKFKLGNKEGWRRGREAKPFKAAKPQLHQGMNNSLYALGRTSHHRRWMEGGIAWELSIKHSLWASLQRWWGTSILMSIKTNKCFFHPFCGSAIKLTGRNNISKTVLCSGGDGFGIVKKKYILGKVKNGVTPPISPRILCGL